MPIKVEGHLGAFRIETMPPGSRNTHYALKICVVGSATVDDEWLGRCVAEMPGSQTSTKQRSGQCSEKIN